MTNYTWWGWRGVGWPWAEIRDVLWYEQTDDSNRMLYHLREVSSSLSSTSIGRQCKGRKQEFGSAQSTESSISALSGQQCCNEKLEDWCSAYYMNFSVIANIRGSETRQHALSWKDCPINRSRSGPPQCSKARREFCLFLFVLFYTVVRKFFYSSIVGLY